MTLDEVMTEIRKDQLFYEESGGGATFSGGEVFLQENFLISLLAECKKNDIHTCIDTTGFVSAETLKRVIPLTDTFLFDIKLMDELEHIRYCGVSNTQILENFKTVCESKSDVRLRFPVIPGITDTDHNITALAEFASGFEGLNIDLLPYHKIGKDKYRRLGMEFMMEGVESPSHKYMQELADIFKCYGLNVKIGG